MRRLSTLAFLLFLASAATMTAQVPFLLSVDPHVRTVGESETSVTYRVAVTALIDYQASIFLGATIPTLPGAVITFDREQINAPYTDTAIMTVRLTGPKSGGTHKINLEARNGMIRDYETVSLIIPEEQALGWRVYSRANSPYDAGHFALDRERGIGWFSRPDSLRSFDGTTWASYAWPMNNADGGSNNPRGLAVDDDGAVWAMVEGYPATYIATLKNGAWMVHNADINTGMTEAMMEYFRFTREHGSRIMVGKNNTIWAVGVGALLKYADGRWTLYDHQNSELPPAEHNEALVDLEGNVWIASIGAVDGNVVGKLVRFDGTYWTIYRTSDLIPGHSQVNPTFVDPSNRLYMNISTTQGAWFDGQNVTLLGAGSTPADRAKSAAFFESDGDIWYGLWPSDAQSLEGGLARYDGQRWWTYTIGNSGLPESHVLGVDVDDRGAVWIRTVSQDGQNPISYLALVDGNASPLSLFSVTSAVPETPAAHAGEISVYPNPTDGRIAVRFESTPGDEAHVSVLDTRGTPMTVPSVATGDGGFSVDASELPAGAYFLRIVRNERVDVRSFVIDR